MSSGSVRLGLAAVACLLTACATGFSAERGQQIEERVGALENAAPTARADSDRAAAREQAQRVDARIAALEAKLGEVAAATQRAREAQAGAATGGARASDDLARVRKQLEEQDRRIATLDATIARLQAAQRAPAASAPAKRAAAAKGSVHRVSTATPPAGASEPAEGRGPAEVLQLAQQQESQGQRAVARDLYEEYVRKFPSDPRSAEARLRLGELAFAERRYQDAIVEFGKVAQGFPRSEQAPGALLRVADSMLAAGMENDAKVVLADIPKRYPNSAVATRARERLSQLGGRERQGR